MTDPLEPLLMRLPAPEPPPTLAANVMARIERLPDHGAGDASVNVTARSRRERLWWVSAIAGILVVVGLSAQGWMDGGYLRDVMTARIGFRGALPMPVDATGGGLLLIGLLLFLFGVFAPLDRGQRVGRSAK
jgi:hypothetical protein